MLCPARVGYSTHEGFDFSPSPEMFFGTLIHAIIDLHVSGRNQDRLIVSTLSGVTNLLVDLAEKESITVPDDMASSLAEEALDAYRRWVADWWIPVGQELQIVSTEQIVYKQIGSDPEIWLQGTPDLVHEGGLVDWKTAGRGWDEGKAATRIQAPLYAFLAGFEETRVDFVVYNRSKGVWNVHQVVVDARQVNAALATAREYGRMIAANVYPPTPSAPTGKTGRGWWCSAKYCGAWNICEYKHLISDGQADALIRTPTWE